ncbi:MULTISPECIES: hypothetical protein [Glycomyces]|jgi:hypothetical protein|uniref:Uncharacterized protein n=2 Tax=Glycomyces TaxID=58113 RepID=A0A9X3SVK8_9ACTN|nr:hypothetical protein [Glycomyces lechevalierae]MDA1384917.1 hypothetical protein [Glycomyces lechevalierae]MDR7337631.1 hypothetical protein [Glycomyces lechevalierae]
MTAEAPKAEEAAEETTVEEPLNREQRRALARGKKAEKTGHQAIGNKKGSVRSQMPKGGPSKFQLPTKNG